MKPIIVSVFSLQRDEYGEESIIELVSTGQYYKKGTVHYILYEESAITGMEGVTTLIKVYESHAQLIRMGKVNQRQEFRVGEETISRYGSDVGDLQIKIKTYDLQSSIDDGQGTLVIGYDVELVGLMRNYNQLSIKIEEERK